MCYDGGVVLLLVLLAVIALAIGVFAFHRKASRSTRPGISDQQIVSYTNVYSTRPEGEDAPAGTIYTRPAEKQPPEVPLELVRYLEDSRVSADVLDAVRRTEER